MAEREYDLVVIGAGPGGYVAAIRGAQLGLTTAVVESDPRLGGTCLLRGCIPTKALLHTADLLGEIAGAKRSGIVVGEPRLDFPAAMRNKDDVVAKNAKGVEFLFKKHKIQVERGRGRLLGADRIEVTQDGASRTLVARRGVILAMGSRPRELRGFASDGKHILTSDHLLEIQQVPARLAVLGAGAVGVEFASAFARFGSKTTLIEMLPRVLPIEDEEVSAEVERSFKKQGIEVRTNATLKSAAVAGGAVQLAVERSGKEEALEVDVLLVAVGRAPNSERCGLEETGVKLERGYVAVDPYMQSSLPGVYAIGDLVNTPWLAHVASAEGVIAAERIAGQPSRALNYQKIPGCTYCHPEVASIGLSEAAARAQGHQVVAAKFPWAASGKARILGDAGGFLKIVRETRYDEILGVHIVGPHATDLIGEACALLGLEATNEELSRIVHPHPTLTEGMLEAAHAAAGHPLAF